MEREREYNVSMREKELSQKRDEDFEDKGMSKRKGKGVPLTLHALHFSYWIMLKFGA